MEFTDRKQENGVHRQKVEEMEFTARQKVGELEFTDRKQENWSLQIESKKTIVYRQKVRKLQFTDRKQENWSLQI